MTKRKHLKGRVRRRAAKTGESYTTALRQIRAHTEGTTMPSQTDETIDETTEVRFKCSFCKKSQTEVKKLIAGPGVYICDECIGLCNGIITEEERTGERAPSPKDAPVEVLLRHLGGIVQTGAEIEDEVRRRAQSLRARGASIQQIADAAGLTVEDATTRFAL